MDSGWPNFDTQKLRSDDGRYRWTQEKEKENKRTGIEGRNDTVIMEGGSARSSSIA